MDRSSSNNSNTPDYLYSSAMTTPPRYSVNGMRQSLSSSAVAMAMQSPQHQFHQSTLQHHQQQQQQFSNLVGGGMPTMASGRRFQVNPVHWPMTLEGDMTVWRQIDSTFLSYDRYYSIPGRMTSPTERLEIILTHQSLLVKATDLATFITKCPPESLKDNYKLIVNSIFVTHEREQAWDLRNIQRVKQPQEAAAVLKLLAPDGPLVTLALRLMDDHNFVVEFPLDGLPPQLKKRVMDRNPPAFFGNKIGTMGQGFGLPPRPYCLFLNPFEYFVMSFASANLLGVTTGKPADYLIGWASLQDTLYNNILEDFLAYYFPCNGGGVPSHQFNHVMQQQSVFVANSLLQPQQQSTSNSRASLDSTFVPRLFKQSVVQELVGNATQKESVYLSTHPAAYKEIWRSEVTLHIFMEVWMCGYYDGGLDKSSSSNNFFEYGGLPPVEVIKSIRMLVRHLHFFINCVNGRISHPMEEVRRTSYPLFQRRLYSFLCYLFNHWPLDNSFRIVYETWLSYIQPWRYVNTERMRGVPSREQNDGVVIDRRWLSFLSENILFYTKIMAQMLVRLERIDLASTKNALMFYRVAKVFAVHENLKLMLQEIERAICVFENENGGGQMNNLTLVNASPQKSFSPLHSSFTCTTFGTSGVGGGGGSGSFGVGGMSRTSLPASSLSSSSTSALYSTPNSNRESNPAIRRYFGKTSPIVGAPAFVSPSVPTSINQAHGQEGLGTPTTAIEAGQSLSVHRIAQLYQLIRDWENHSHYFYEPLFSPANVQKAKFIVTCAKEARENFMQAADKITASQQKEENILRQIFNAFFADTSKKVSLMENVSEKMKAANQLDAARNQCIEFFNLQLPEHHLPTSSTPAAASGASTNINGVSAMRRRGITPYTFDEITTMECEDRSYSTGNPDDFLFSGETKLVVKALQKIAGFFNYVLAEQMEDLYFRPDWLGRYARACFTEPTQYFTIEKGWKNGERWNKRIRHYLPPRIVLRQLGTHLGIFCLFLMVIFKEFLGLSFPSFILYILLFYLFYLTVRTTSEPINKLTELEEFRNQFKGGNGRNNGGSIK